MIACWRCAYCDNVTLIGLLALCAADLASSLMLPITMYNYGSPRVGNIEFVQYLDTLIPTIYRAVNQAGILTMSVVLRTVLWRSFVSMTLARLSAPSTTKRDIGICTYSSGGTYHPPHYSSQIQIATTLCLSKVEEPSCPAIINSYPTGLVADTHSLCFVQCN